MTRENFSSMKKFTDKVFLIVRQLRASGKVISDDEINGVLELGVDRDLYAIQIRLINGPRTKMILPLFRSPMSSSSLSASISNVLGLLTPTFSLLELYLCEVVSLSPTLLLPAPPLIPFLLRMRLLCALTAAWINTLWKPVVGKRSTIFRFKSMLSMPPLVPRAVPDTRNSLPLPNPAM